MRNTKLPIVIAATCSLLALAATTVAGADTKQSGVTLGAWTPPTTGVRAEAVDLGGGKGRRGGWGSYAPHERKYFPEFLPAIFERTLGVDDLPAQRGFDWVFTGERAGLYLSVSGKQVSLKTVYYDSPGFNLLVDEPCRFPKLSAPTRVFDIADDGPLQSISIRLDHTLTLTVSLNGREVHQQLWMEGFRRHQLRLTGRSGVARFHLFQPDPVASRVNVNPGERHQTMMGWGGITTPTAYDELSPAGRRQWWELLCEYNLLVQRECPVGGMLNRCMDNWDNLNDAKAHYYADNFPNGEASNFDYNRAIQSLGGLVIFEFWDFPPWIRNDPKRYAEAMVNYCQTARKRTGRPPAIVGLQNECPMKLELIEPFAVALRTGPAHGRALSQESHARRRRDALLLLDLVEHRATHLRHDPYHQNLVLPASPESESDKPVTIPPGGILTRSTTPLIKLPAGFQAP